jgi:hypothetical protein
MLLIAGIIFMLPVWVRDTWETFPRSCDVEVVPEPDQFDPRMIAGALAMIQAQVLATGRPLRVRLNAVRGRRGDWQPYEIRFRRQEREVRVQSLREPQRCARVPLGCEWIPEHESTVRVGADGGWVLNLHLEGLHVISRSDRFRLRPNSWLRLTGGRRFRLWSVFWLSLSVLVWNLARYAGVAGGATAASYFFWIGLAPIGLVRLAIRARKGHRTQRL